MENYSGIQASLSGRYALALFELACDYGDIASVKRSLAKLKKTLSVSADFKALTSSPLISRADAGKAASAVASWLGLDTLTTNFLGVLSHNGRLLQLSDVIHAFENLMSNHKGETRAEVTSAHPLGPAQIEEISKKLRTRVGREVAVDVKVDHEILGGLVVRIGSQMIDSSIRTRLNTLAQAMKG